MSDQMRRTFCSTAGVIADSGFRSRNRILPFWLATITLATALFAPPLTNAQKCIGNINTGCRNAGAVCSPVDVGTGKTGHCVTVPGPPGERECNCVGTPVTPQPPSPKAMDVMLSKDSVDHNGFARNPAWFQVTQTGQPPDPCAFCPCKSEDPQEWKANNCTNQILHFNSSDFCSGHMNWLPVEYEASTITWAEHSTGLFDDDDYFFYVKRPDQSIKTAGQGDSRDGTEIEFDAGETVDNWDGTHTWWEDFHHAVDSNDGHTDGAAGNMIDGHEAIIIGMLGLDTQHDVHSELHPVYAMFVRLPGPLLASQDRWAFFVRNWGNEGGCGSDQEPIPWNTIQVRLPQRGAGNPVVKDNVWVYWNDDDNGCSQQTWSFQRVQDGLLLTFSLQDASQQCGFMGDLAIDWGAPPASAAHSERPAIATGQVGTGKVTTGQVRVVRAPDEDVDPVLKSKIEKLDPTARKLLSEQVRNLMRQPHTQRKQPAKSASPVPEPRKVAGAVPWQGANLKSVPDRSAKKAKRRELILSFLKAHGIE